MTRRRVGIAIMLSVASLAGCDPSADTSDLTSTISGFVVDFARQILAAFLL